MITKEQEKWIEHLSDTDHTEIVDFDPSSDEKFEKIKSRLAPILGPETNILHRGSTALRISGQAEIDIYIPVPPWMFDEAVSKMKDALGKPYSEYPSERVKFIMRVDGRRAEVMVVNSEHASWIDGERIFEHLSNDHADRMRYEKLKKECASLSTRMYYRRKIEFFNEMLVKAAHHDSRHLSDAL